MKVVAGWLGPADVNKFETLRERLRASNSEILSKAIAELYLQARKRMHLTP